MSKNFEILTSLDEDRDLFTRNERKPTLELRHNISGIGSGVREEIVQLVRRVFISANTHCAVAFSAVDSGDGATWISAQVARVLADSSAQKVCAVDTNLDSPDLHRYFGVKNSAGLAHAVLGNSSVRNFVQPSNTQNLWVLSAGESHEARTSLAADSLRERIDELRRDFQFLIFDTPPLSRCSDVLSFGKFLDGVVLVVGAGLTRRDAARRATLSLNRADVRVLGSVLNRRAYPIPEAIYRRL